ncbi:MAG TPA: 2-hydroxyglutaryl-CoA dehydratase, partial [Firmicutes bacterium]|nr:2-hydroxyglutaryl-CoA dehydratase [Bacillota bacterium]
PGGAEPAGISSMCTVFAESEVISLVASGAEKASIVAGLHHAVAERIAALAAGFLPVACIAFTGGVAKNSGIKRALEQILGCPLLLPEDPQIIGALGAAIIGQERLDRRRI